MSHSLSALLRHLVARRVGESSFVAESFDLGWGRVYGGQTMGQSLSAAEQTVAPSRALHAFSCQFLRAGAVDRPIRFEVTRLQDSGSFSVRWVLASQAAGERGDGDERAIFALTASYMAPERGYEHQRPTTRERADATAAAHGESLVGAVAARAPGDELLREPEALAPLHERYAALEGIERWPERLRDTWTRPQALELRPHDFVPPGDSARRDARAATWLRAREPMPDAFADDAHASARLLAYASDWGFLSLAVRPHEANLFQGIQAASLSHSMYFHRPPSELRLDEWHCLSATSPAAGGGRGFVAAEIFTRDGVLVASAHQEGLIRKRREKRRAAVVDSNSLSHLV